VKASISAICTNGTRNLLKRCRSIWGLSHGRLELNATQTNTVQRGGKPQLIGTRFDCIEREGEERTSVVVNVCRLRQAPVFPAQFGRTAETAKITKRPGKIRPIDSGEAQIQLGVSLINEVEQLERVDTELFRRLDFDHRSTSGIRLSRLHPLFGQ